MDTRKLIVLLLVTALFSVSSQVLAVGVGDRAPGFTLQSALGEPVSLSQFKGEKNVLLAFYVFDFSPT